MITRSCTHAYLRMSHSTSDPSWEADTRWFITFPGISTMSVTWLVCHTRLRSF